MGCNSMMPTPNFTPLGDSIYESVKRQQEKHIEYLAEVAKWHPATYFHLARIGVGLAARGVKSGTTALAQSIDKHKKKIVLLGVAEHIYSKRSTLDTNPRGRLARPMGATRSGGEQQWKQSTLTYQIGVAVGRALGLVKD